MGAFYGGDVKMAVRMAASLTQFRDSGLVSIQREAMHLQARAYWARGDRKRQARAQKIWEMLGKKSGGRVGDWVTMSAALQAKSPELSSLERILGAKDKSLTTAEAGIELARQYVLAKRFDDAEKTLKYVTSLLKDKKTLAVMETTLAAIKPFLDESNAALARLKYERNAGLKEFEEAENLSRLAVFVSCLFLKSA